MSHLRDPATTLVLRDAASSSMRGSAAQVEHGAIGREAEARRFLALCGTAFLAIFALCWLYTAALPMAFLSRDYPAWVAKRQMMAACDIGAVAIFGDSRAMAGIQPAALPFAASNLAFSASSPIEAYFAVKRVLRCSKMPRAVVIGFSAGKYMGDSDYWNIATRVGVLNFADTRAVQAVSRKLHDSEINKLAAGDHLTPLARESLYALRFPSLYFGSILKGYGFLRYFHNVASELAIKRDRGQAFFGTAEGSAALASEANLSRFRPSPLIDHYLRKMLQQLSARHVPVYLLSMPINDATCSKMRRSLRPDLTGYLRSIAAPRSDVHLIGPVMPCWPDRYFGDAFHLNALGAAVFTRTFARWFAPVVTPAQPSAQVAVR